ncbi:MAG: hypothetical protein HY551_05385 [Elusimicrobia bacterium]|nr:hypothetical protein [Elusimicrobiota bacterium]
MRRLVLSLGVMGAALAVLRAEDPQTPPSVISEDITIRGRAPREAALGPLPAPPSKAAAREVIQSLRIYKNDYRKGGATIRIPETLRRLDRPFPEPPYLTFPTRAFPRPYKRWRFEVFEQTRIVWRIEGDTRGDPDSGGETDEAQARPSTSVPEEIAWDGLASSGRLAIRVGEAYGLRFTGIDGKREYSMASEPIEFTSLALPQGFAGTRLEAANALIFIAERAALAETSQPYIQEIADRFRRYSPKAEKYRFVLYQENPRSKLAAARSSALRRQFADILLVNPSRIAVEVLGWGERGDVLACVIPSETGALLDQQ